MFNGEITNEIKIVINYLKKFKKSKLNINKDIYNAARCKLQKMIVNKKISFFENKLTEFIGKLKDLRKALKSLGLSSKTYFCEVSVLEINHTVQHHFKYSSRRF